MTSASFAGIWLGEADNDYDYMADRRGRKAGPSGLWAAMLVFDGYLQLRTGVGKPSMPTTIKDGSGCRFTPWKMTAGSTSSAYGCFNYGEADGSISGMRTAAVSPRMNEPPDWNGSLNGDPEFVLELGFRPLPAECGGIRGHLVLRRRPVGGDLYRHRRKWKLELLPARARAESAEMDCGTFSYSTDEVSTYYADSTLYDGVSYQVFEGRGFSGLGR
ncbi:MAG: hypothetical protein V8R55_13795 [Dysosmobacter sp.]